GAETQARGSAIRPIHRSRFPHPCGDLDPVAGHQPCLDAAEVGFDGAEGDIEVLTDLLVGPTVRDEPGDFELSGTQPLDRMGAPLRCPAAPSQQVEGQGRGDQGVAVRSRPDSGDEEVGTGVLEQEAAGTSVECGIDVFLVIEGRDHDDLRVGRDLGQGRETVEAGHADVEEDDIGSFPPGQVDRLGTIGGLPDHADRLLGVEAEGESHPHHLLIIDHGDCAHRPSPFVVSGRQVRTVQPSRSGPASIVPPVPGPLRTDICSVLGASSLAVTWTVTGASGPAGRRTLVRVSTSTRSSTGHTASSSTAPTSIAICARSPKDSTRSRRAWGPSAIGVRDAASVRVSLTSRRISSSARVPEASILPRAVDVSCALSLRPAAWARTTIPVISWAMTSWSSVAMRR